MLGWLDRLSPREMALIGATVLLGGGALIYLLLIEPLQQESTRILTDLKQAREMNEFLRTERRTHAELLAGGTRMAPDAPSDAPRTLAALEKDLREADLAEALDRMAPQGDTRVELVFDTVGYGALMGWLVRSGLDRRVLELSAVGVDSADWVNATVTLDLGAGSE